MKTQRGAGFSAQMMKRDPPGAQPERLLQSGVAPVLTASRISCYLTEALAGFRNQHVEEEIYVHPPNSPVQHSDQHTGLPGEAEEASERQAPVALGL